MKKIVESQDGLIKSMQEMGRKQLFLAQFKDTNDCCFMINNDYIEGSNETSIKCYMRDLHHDALNITAFVFAIKLGEKVYIAFIDLKNFNNVNVLKNIIAQDKFKLRVINEREDYFLLFPNPSKDDFSKLFDTVHSAVQNENYSTEDFTKFINNLCKTYSNEELWDIWENEQ